VRAVLAKARPASEGPTRSWTTPSGRSSRAAVVAGRGRSTSSPRPGSKKPDISILSDEFLAEVRGMPQRNLAVELLQKLLKGEIKTAGRKRNVVQARSFAEMLEQTVRKYQNRAIEAAQVIEELIQLAREMREAHARGGALRLSEDELAFYDALETNDSAVKVLGDDRRCDDRQELVDDRARQRDHRLDAAGERPGAACGCW
jgi:type I restriction enzyme R subunit